MLGLSGRILRRLYSSVTKRSPLTENGERVDIDLRSKPHYALMDMYEKSHYKRYLFAKQYVKAGMTCGDFACGSGYGSALLAEAAGKVTGIDIKQHVVDAVTNRYANLRDVKFICHDLRTIEYDSVYDLITSFETIEHVEEDDLIRLFRNFSRALKPDGILIFSAPYLQKKSREAVELGFHLTFDIDEAKIRSWLALAGFLPEGYFYQNYNSHDVVETLLVKDFVVCVARKVKAAT